MLRQKTCLTYEDDQLQVPSWIREPSYGSLSKRLKLRVKTWGAVGPIGVLTHSHGDKDGSNRQNLPASAHLRSWRSPGKGLCIFFGFWRDSALRSKKVNYARDRSASFNWLPKVGDDFTFGHLSSELCKPNKSFRWLLINISTDLCCTLRPWRL